MARRVGVAGPGRLSTLAPMGESFPIHYAVDVEATASFYERLGFRQHLRLPEEGPPGYVGLRRGADDLAVVARAWPAEQYGIEPGSAPTSELFVYVEDADRTVRELVAAGAPLVRTPELMPWGERVGFVLDPDGRPVAVAARPPD